MDHPHDNVRAMAAAVVLKAMHLLAMDHSWHRASITPTVTLGTDLSHAFETNKWRNGQVVVTLKDSVLEPPRKCSTILAGRCTPAVT